MSEPDTTRYCGSETAHLGIDSRLSSYISVNKGSKKVESERNGNWLIRKDVRVNLSCIAVFNSCETPKPYVLLMELLSTILLQTLPLSDDGRYRNASTVEMVRKAMPQDLPEARHTPSNGAVQCLQPLSRGRRKGDEVCLNCSTMETRLWYSETPVWSSLVESARPVISTRERKMGRTVRWSWRRDELISDGWVLENQHIRVTIEARCNFYDERSSQ